MKESLEVELRGKIDHLQKELSKARGELDKFASGVEGASNKANSAFSSMGSGLKGVIAGYVSLSAAIATVGATFDRALKLDSINASLTAVMGSAEAASQQFDRLSSFADQYGLDLLSVAESYKGFAAASINANIPLEETNYIFESVAKAASVLKLSGDDLKGSLNALSQMISKGTVQAEELRGQLGERLPGAFQLAAKAMGVTTMELGKMLENGEVLASELLPRLAAELNNTYGDKIVGKVDSLQASVNRLNNTFTKAVNDGHLSKFFQAFVDGANETLEIIESKTWGEFFGRFAAAVTQNEFLEKSWDYQRIALEKLKKTQESIKPYTPPTDPPKLKSSGQRNLGDDIEKMAGAKDQIKTANELLQLYKDYPAVLQLLSQEYASNMFFRDLINGTLKSKIDELPDSIKKLEERLKGASDTFGGFTKDESTEIFIENIKNLSDLLGNTLATSFETAMESGQDFFNVLGDALKKLLIRLVSTVAAAAALAGILSIFTGGAGLAAVGGFSGILKGLSGFNIGGFGGGGDLASGLGGETEGGRVVFEIAGDKLVGVINNTNNRFDRLI